MYKNDVSIVGVLHLCISPGFALYICTYFCENIQKGFRVIERTNFQYYNFQTGLFDVFAYKLSSLLLLAVSDYMLSLLSLATCAYTIDSRYLEVERTL